MRRHFLLLTWLFTLLFLRDALQGHEIIVNTQEGETFVLDIDPEESLSGLQDKIAALSQGRNSDLLIEVSSKKIPQDFILPISSRDQGGYLGYPRNYFVEVTPDEKADVRYIVTTLANKTLVAIALAKSSIEDAGSRIDHLHPLRFLMAIFSDEELKAGIRNIRGRGWIWNQFTGGIKGTLAVEMSLDNVKIEQVLNFSEVLKINPGLILPSIMSQNWDEFIDLLIKLLPRKGNHDRYDT